MRQLTRVDGSSGFFEDKETWICLQAVEEKASRQGEIEDREQVEETGLNGIPCKQKDLLRQGEGLPHCVRDIGEVRDHSRKHLGDRSLGGKGEKEVQSEWTQFFIVKFFSGRVLS